MNPFLSRSIYVISISHTFHVRFIRYISFPHAVVYVNRHYRSVHILQPCSSYQSNTLYKLIAGALNSDRNGFYLQITNGQHHFYPFDVRMCYLVRFQLILTVQDLAKGIDLGEQKV
jgi:hypothetical protein